MESNDESLREYDEAHLDRVVREVLDPVDVYEASAGGPEGPWYYKSLTIRRVMNEIRVYDVDGDLWKSLSVPDLSEDRYTDDPYRTLRDTFDRYHRHSLGKL